MVGLPDSLVQMVASMNVVIRSLMTITETYLVYSAWVQLRNQNLSLNQNQNHNLSLNQNHNQSQNRSQALNQNRSQNQNRNQNQRTFDILKMPQDSTGIMQTTMTHQVMKVWFIQQSIGMIS